MRWCVGSKIGTSYNLGTYNPIPECLLPYRGAFQDLNGLKPLPPAPKAFCRGKSCRNPYLKIPVAYLSLIQKYPLKAFPGHFYTLQKFLWHLKNRQLSLKWRRLSSHPSNSKRRHSSDPSNRRRSLGFTFSSFRWKFIF